MACVPRVTEARPDTDLASPRPAHLGRLVLHLEQPHEEVHAGREQPDVRGALEHGGAGVEPPAARIAVENGVERRLKWCFCI